MKDRIPRDGAPATPESVSLSPEDSALAVAAVSYYVASEVQSLEANWGSEAFRGMLSGIDSALERLEGISMFVEHGRGLAAKLADHHEDPTRPVELTDPDIELLGYSLFRFGNDGYVRATEALGTGSIQFVEEGAERETYEELGSRQAQSKKIFDELGLLARGREIRWMNWSSGSATRLGRVALN